MSTGESSGSVSSMFGLLDIVVLGGVATAAFYWFVIRRRRQKDASQVPNIQALKIIPPAARTDSYDPSFVSKMKRTGKNVVVFYGSQTGTAEEFASRLAKECARYGMKGMAADPEECEMEELLKLPEIDNSLAIFCMATYGEGDPTDNAQEFHDWIKDGDQQLTGLRYAVFALGNKTYEHYNTMGKYVDSRLAELGAERVFELGLGDDDANIEEDFVTWKERLWPAVCQHFGIEASGDDVNMRQYALTLYADGAGDELAEPPAADKVYRGEPARLRSYVNQRPPYDAKNPYLAPIQQNRELHTTQSPRSCMHIELDLADSRLRYDAGDHVAVLPSNDAQLVEALGARLGQDLGRLFTLTNLDEEATKRHPFPCPTSYRTALLHYVDITHPPRTNVIRELAEWTQDEQERARLILMATNSDEGRELYNRWVVSDQRHILAVLDEFPGCRPPLDLLLELLPRLQARYYSIASSPRAHPRSVHVCALLVEYKTSAGRDMRGVTTGYLQHKRPLIQSDDVTKPAESGDVTVSENGSPPRMRAADNDESSDGSGDHVVSHRVPIFIRKSQFRLPFKPSVPVILVGPGTGVAPMRGFIQERDALRADGRPVGDTLLYFGCRSRHEDFLYENELREYERSGSLTELHVAFSRDQADKVYVQHLLVRDAERVWRLIDAAGAHLYVCGDARHMAKDVDRALHEIVERQGGLSADAAQDYLKRLRSRGRYCCDVWS